MKFSLRSNFLLCFKINISNYEMNLILYINLKKNIENNMLFMKKQQLFQQSITYLFFVFVATKLNSFVNKTVFVSFLFKAN
jgi:hypothetical protein